MDQPNFHLKLLQNIAYSLYMHAVMSILVFAAIALFDQNVVNCFSPEPSNEIQEMLTVLPVAIGVFCSMLFVVFPTERHGIGLPLSTS
jgi:hypothetical protein